MVRASARSSRSLVALFAVVVSTHVAPMPAQSVWIVDRLQRPGSNFRDIPEAVAAAHPGDWIFVRYQLDTSKWTQAYTAPSVTKPLTILGEVVNGSQRPWVTGTLSVVDIARGQRVTIGSLSIHSYGGSPQSTAALRASSSAGRIVLIELEVASVTSTFLGMPITTGVQITDCADVVLNGCRFSTMFPGNRAVRSRLWIENSWLDAPGWDYVNWSTSSPGVRGGTGLDLHDSTAVLERSTVLGSGGSSTGGVFNCTTTYRPVGPAVELDARSRLLAGRGSQIRGSSNSCGNYCCGTFPTITYNTAVAGAAAGQLMTDPGCTVLGNVIPSQTTARIDQTDIPVARLGGTATVTTFTAPGAFVLTAAGYALDSPLPSSLGEVWVDPQGAILLGLAAANSQGVVAFSLPMSTSVFFGHHVAAQSALLLPTQAMVMSMPAFTANLPPSR